MQSDKLSVFDLPLDGFSSNDVVYTDAMIIYVRFKTLIRVSLFIVEDLFFHLQSQVFNTQILHMHYQVTRHNKSSDAAQVQSESNKLDRTRPNLASERTRKN